MKIRNISGKIIGLGSVYVLPDEEVTVPAGFEKNPAIEIYKNLGIVTVTEENIVADKKTVLEDVDAEKSAEELRKARLASLNGISDDDLGTLANSLGINPAECKDQADVLKKVKAALKK